MLNPEKEYGIEIRINENTSEEFQNYIYQKLFEAQKELKNLGIEFKNIDLEKEKIKNIISIKKGDVISEFLTYINASVTYLEFEKIRVNKEIKNDINRVVNFEVANINRSIETGAKQLKSAQYILENELEDRLTKKQLELVNFKIKNPDLNLNELSDKIGVSKSSISNRFKDILKIIEEYKKENK